MKQKGKNVGIIGAVGHNGSNRRVKDETNEWMDGWQKMACGEQLTANASGHERMRFGLRNAQAGTDCAVMPVCQCASTPGNCSALF